MILLDASAVIALLRKEPGADMVRALMPEAKISVVNLTEVYEIIRRQKLDMQPLEISGMLTAAAVETILPDEETALLAAEMMAGRTPPGHGRISLGDGYCLAHAYQRGVPALTADRAWAETEFQYPVKIELIR